jgi:hypothetical protein
MRRDQGQNYTCAGSKPASSTNYHRTTTTTKTAATGKCRRVGCLGCHSHPVNKSVLKAKGHLKRTAWDVTINHHLDNWRVCTEVTYDSEADLNASSGIWGTESSALDQSCTVVEDDDHHEQQLVRNQPIRFGSYSDEEVEDLYALDQQHESHEQSAGDQSAGIQEPVDPELKDLVGEEEEEEEEEAIPEFEAFEHGSFESFKSIEEAARCEQEASDAVSEDSWSGIELSGDDDGRSQTSWDDWSLVDEELV